MIAKSAKIEGRILSVLGADLGDAEFLFLVLELIELPVDSAMGEQFLVITDLPYMALVHDDNLVGTLNGGEPVGNDHGGAALDHVGERVADAQFGFSVHAGGSFIEHQDFRIVGQGPRKRNE